MHNCQKCDIERDGVWHIASACRNCGGSGKDFETGDICEICLGEGLLICPQCKGTGVDPNIVTEETRVKYPRTFHLPWSLGATDDDKILRDTSCFEDKFVVITEKLDGENCTMGRTYTHARSVDGRHHPSRDYIKRMHSEIGYQIPTNWRLCGENLYARHSIGYDQLEDYFYLFSVWDENNICLSWSDTLEVADMLGILVAPVLYAGPWDEDECKACYTGESMLGGVQEGYVVRNAGAFLYEDFRENVAKFVRRNHVTTDSHWKTSWEPNRLK